MSSPAADAPATLDAPAWRERLRLTLAVLAIVAAAEWIGPLWLDLGLARVALLPMLIALLAAFTWLSATQAAMLTVPTAVIAVLLWQRTAPRQVLSEVSETLIGMRNETFIFASSALLAGLVASVLPAHHLADQLGSTPMALFGLGAVGALAVMALALLGVAPLISLNLCAALLAQLASQGLTVTQPAVALLFGFSLAMLLSPYGPSAVLLARHAQLSPWRIAVGWNGRFVLSVLIPLLLIPLLA